VLSVEKNKEGKAPQNYYHCKIHSKMIFALKRQAGIVSEMAHQDQMDRENIPW